MKWRVEQDEWWPVFRIEPLSAECAPELDLTEDEEAQIRNAESAFCEAQELIRSKLEAADMLDCRGRLKIEIPQ